MLELAFYPAAVRLGMQLVTLLTLIAQEILCVLSFYRGGFRRRNWLGRLVEAVAALQIALWEIMLELVEFNTAVGVAFSAPRLTGIRYCACVVLFSLTATAFFQRRRLWDALCALCTVLTLPFMEQFSGAAFPFLLAASVLVMLIRAIVCSLKLRGEIRQGLSGLSIKEAVDKLPAGVLFARKNGTVLLANLSMETLMAALMFPAARGAYALIDFIENASLPEGIERQHIGECIALKMQDGAVWQFAWNRLQIGKSKDMEIYALDISEQWRLTVLLENERASLSKQKARMTKLLESIERLRYQQELKNQKARVHDLLGQRVALLQRAVQEKRPTRRESLARDIETLGATLREEETSSPAQVLEQLSAAFSEIGVKLCLVGALPEKDELAACMNEMIRECCTNAVRHGFAAKVEARVEKTAEGWRLTVSNDGERPSHIAEGGGIGGMRRRVEAQNGTLCIRMQAENPFAISAEFKSSGKKSIAKE